MKARPVVTSVSHATRPIGSSRRTASKIASEIWSAILSGCPSVTDSDVKKCLPLLSINALLAPVGGRLKRGRLPFRSEARQRSRRSSLEEPEHVARVRPPRDPLQTENLRRRCVRIGLEDESSPGADE